MASRRNVHIPYYITITLGLVVLVSVSIIYYGFPNRDPNQPLFTTTRHPSVGILDTITRKHAVYLPTLLERFQHFECAP